MKKLFILLILIVSISHTKANRIILNAYQGSDHGYYINSSFPYNPGDTFVLSGTWSYCSMDHINGTAAKHVVFINNGNCDMAAGFSFMACHYVDVAKSSTGYFKIHDDINKNNVGITVTGLSHVVTINNIEIYNKLYGMWIKWESNQTGCDSTQWYPHYEDSITVVHCKIHDVNQEGIYGGSTDPSGVSVERAVTCYGVHFTPRSAALKDIFIEYDSVWNTGRTGIQLSALSFGKYRVNHNWCRNNGFETSLDKWPNIWIGGEGQASGEIAYNILDSASRNNITCYGNHAYIHDNTAVHDGSARDFNTGVIYNITYYSNLAVEIKPTNPYTKTNFKIENNTFTPSFTNAAVYIDGEAKDFTDTGNYICNSGTVLVTDPQTKYFNGCGGGDTTRDTIKVACDSSWHAMITKTKNYDSLGVMRNDTIPDTSYYDRGSRYRAFDKIVFKARLYHLSKDTVVDTLYHCDKCGHCDSIVINVGTATPPTNYGLLDANGVDNTPALKIARATALGCKTIRYIFNRGLPNYQVPTYKNAGFKVSMTFNWDPVTAVAPYPSDTAAVTHFLDSLFAANSTALPDYLFIANEPANESYHTVDGAAYVKFLTACVRIAHKWNIPVSIGGSTQDIIYPLNNYYIAHGLTDSTAYLQSIFGTLNPASPGYVAKSNFYSVVIPAAATLGLFGWNGHWYEWPNATDTAHYVPSKLLTVAANFIKQQTGLNWVCDEFGTRNFSTVFFNLSLDEMRAIQKILIVYYLSDNSGPAINNEAAYGAYITAHH
jgi:hypothetical protein